MRRFSSKSKTVISEPVITKRTFKNLGNFRPGETISQWSQSALQDRYFWIFLIGWFLPLISSVLYVAVNYSLLPNYIPLFYSRMWGESQLAPAIYIYLPLVGTLLLGVFNLGLAISFHRRDKVIFYILSSTSALVSILSAITVFKIVNLIK